MSKIPPSVIKEIAREIAIGNTCYLERHTENIITIDHSIEDAEQVAAQEQTQAELEQEIKSYVKIVKLSTEEQLVIMKDFLEELQDKSVRKELANALNRKNPARNFIMVVESDMELNLHWGIFNAKEYQRWVSNLILDAYHYKGS